MYSAISTVKWVWYKKERANTVEFESEKVLRVRGYQAVPCAMCVQPGA